MAASRQASHPRHPHQLLHQLLVFESLRLLVAQTLLLVLLVLGISTLEEINLGITLECEDMCGDTVQEPAVVGNHHGTAGKILETLLQGTYSVDIHVIGRLVEQKDIALILERERQMQPVSFTTGKNPATLLLVGTGEIETRHVCTRIYIPLA